MPTNASPNSALKAVRKVVEQDKVPPVIGPVSGSEGIAPRDYSKTQPGVTFVNGTSGALDTTYVTPSQNFFPSTPTARSGWLASASTSTRSRLQEDRRTGGGRAARRRTPGTIPSGRPGEALPGLLTGQGGRAPDWQTK